METRREWLEKNPPPRAGKNLQALLDELNKKNADRAALVTKRQEWVTYREHWKQFSTPEGQVQVQSAEREIAEADKRLAETADVPSRIMQITEEMKFAANCPVHSGQALHRNFNRPEDMFTCEVGPHHLLWARVNGKAALLPLTDLNLPSLEYPMTDGQAISRAQWLASRPPISVFCPVHPKEAIAHKPDDRVDVFRCQDTPEQVLLWSPAKDGMGALVTWTQGKDLPALEEPL